MNSTTDFPYHVQNIKTILVEVEDVRNGIFTIENFITTEATLNIDVMDVIPSASLAFLEFPLMEIVFKEPMQEIQIKDFFKLIALVVAKLYNVKDIAKFLGENFSRLYPHQATQFIHEHSNLKSFLDFHEYDHDEASKFYASLDELLTAAQDDHQREVESIQKEFKARMPEYKIKISPNRISEIFSGFWALVIKIFLNLLPTSSNTLSLYVKPNSILWTYEAASSNMEIKFQLISIADFANLCQNLISILKECFPDQIWSSQLCQTVIKEYCKTNMFGNFYSSSLCKTIKYGKKKLFDYLDYLLCYFQKNAKYSVHICSSMTLKEQYSEFATYIANPNLQDQNLAKLLCCSPEIKINLMEYLERTCGDLAGDLIAKEESTSVLLLYSAFWFVRLHGQNVLTNTDESFTI